MTQDTSSDEKPQLTTQAAPASFNKIIWEYAQAILIALVLAMFIRTFIVQAFKIPSGSMLQTLQIGDHIFVNKFVYGIRNPFTKAIWVEGGQPKQGDIIVFVYPEDRSKDFIKRIIAVAGDKIEIKNKEVFVNGERIADPESGQRIDPRILPKGVSPRDNYGPVVVPDNSLFVMGDNRDHSHDSRFWGFVPVQDVKGKAFIIYWSWDSDRFMLRLDRLGKLIH